VTGADAIQAKARSLSPTLAPEEVGVDDAGVPPRREPTRLLEMTEQIVQSQGGGAVEVVGVRAANQFHPGHGSPARPARDRSVTAWRRVSGRSTTTASLRAA